MSRRLPSDKTTSRQRNRLASLADRLTDELLSDLRRRAGQPRTHDLDGNPIPRPLEDGALDATDGYGPGGTNTSGSKGEHSDPTAARVAAHAGGRNDDADTWRNTPDPIGDNIVAILDNLKAMHDLAKDTDQRIDYVLNAERANRGRQSSVTTCLVCDTAVSGVGNDRIKAGYCCACYHAWYRSPFFDTGDHLRYRRQRRKELRTRDEDAA